MCIESESDLQHERFEVMNLSLRYGVAARNQSCRTIVSAPY